MIIKADPRARKKTICIFVLLTIVGLLVLGEGLPLLQSHLAALPPERAIRILSISLSVILLSVIPFMVYLYRFGRKVIVSRQCPPPGAKVIRDTVVHTGAAARRIGVILVIGSVTVMLTALVLSLYFPNALTKTLRAPSSATSPARH